MEIKEVWSAELATTWTNKIPNITWHFTASATNNHFVEKLRSLKMLWKVQCQLWISFDLMDSVITSFKSFLSETDTEYDDILYHIEVWWMSDGTILKRFFTLMLETKMFMKEKGKVGAELSNERWLWDFVLLCGIRNTKFMVNKNSFWICLELPEIFKWRWNYFGNCWKMLTFFMWFAS